MADMEFTQICKEILGIGKKLEKIEPDELRKIKTDIERISEAVAADKTLFDTDKKDFDGKYNKIVEIIKTFDTLKAQIEEVLKSGIINDSAEALISTFSSKKIMDLLNKAKGVVDEKFSTIYKNGITPWSSSLDYPAGAISVFDGKLYQAKSENINKNPSENKEEWCVLASEEWCDATFFKKTDKIDTATEQKAGIFKVTNAIKGTRNDVVATEAAVANNTLSFEPYNKVEVDVFSETNKESTVNVKDIFKDGSCKNFYQFNNSCDEYNNIPRTTANNNISYVEGKFGAAVYYNTPGETYPVVQDTNMFDALGHPTQWTISTWAKADDLTSMTNTNYRLWFFGLETNNRSLELRIQTISGQPKLIFALWGDVQILNVNMTDATSWHNYIVSYNNGVTTIYKDGVSVWTYNKSYEITNGRGSPRANFKGAIDQFRFFNRAITASEAKNLSEEARSTEKSFISLKGTVYLSDKSSVSGRYLNTTKVIEAKLPKAQQKADGTYFIKVKQDNSLELVDIRPEFHQKSTTAEYYLDGVWYDKSGNKLQPQTYLPYSVTITTNSITSVNFENIYPSSKELGVGQRWIKVWDDREINIYYTNTYSRSIQVCVSLEAGTIDTSVSVIIDDVIVETADMDNYMHTGFSFIVPPGSKYKVATLSNPSYKKANIVQELQNEKLNNWAELK